MKKKLIKLALFSAILMLSIIGINEVKAETYTGEAIWPSEHISGIFIKKVRNDGYTKYQQARFIRRSEDNRFVYCLQPYTDIDNNLPYYTVIRSDYESVLNMTKDTWTKISLIAYYGYGYSENGYDHNAHKWYAVSQVMIWRLTNPESDIYFTDTLNGNKINSYDDEIREIEALVANHYTKPSFNTENLVLPLSQSTTLNDTNNVLSHYRITSTENVSATINGNNITITATGIGQAKINFAKNATQYTVPPIVYFSNHSQNVFRVGSFDPVASLFNLTVVGGRVEITKLDSYTMSITPSGQATLTGAVYGIYNTNNELLATLTTNNNAYALSGYLPSLGEFYLKEITPSPGYTLDVNKYSFIVDKDNLLASVNVYEKVIDREFEITKVYASDKTMLMTPEVGVDFEVYDNSNRLVGTYKTDNDGKIYFTLPYGEYTLKQKTSTSGYEKIEDYKFEVKEVGEEINKVFSNAEITARLKVIKVDDSGNVIAKNGIKFKIKDTKTNNYVCQKISYPTVQNVCTYETDENGVLMTPYPLNTGTYELEELDQVIMGYLWNSTPLTFTIDENSTLINDEDFNAILEVRFENKEVKGSIEINKTGEDLVIIGNSPIPRSVRNILTKYYYEEIPLANVKYGLYDENDNLITTLITDENGYVKLDNLKLGKYSLKELESSNNNMIDNKVYKFELTYKDQYTPVIVKTFDFQNYLPKGSIDFSKTDLTSGKEIPNVELEIYTINDELIYKGLTNENGKITIDNLFVGKFYIVETIPATGYRLSDEIIYFEILENGNIIKASMTNEKVKGTLEFSKIDLSTNLPLPNTLIEIYNENDELVFSGKTDENGMIIIEELEYGKYYIIEKEAPSGYILNEEKMYFEILEDGQIIKTTMTNEKVEMPKTFNTDLVSIIIISATSIIGVALLVYAKKKKK